jgi:LEA14-like dessication related protein
MKKLLLFLVLIAVVIIAGKWIYDIRSFKEPVFRDIRNLQVIKLEGQLAEISADALFNNPNSFTATLLNTELKVYSNDVLLGQVSQTHITEIPAESDFDIPLTFKVDLLKLGMSQGISGMVENLMNDERLIPVRFEGYCRIRNEDATYKIPITYEDKLVFK